MNKYFQFIFQDFFYLWIIQRKSQKPYFCEKPVKKLHKKAEQPDGPGHSATTLLLHNEDRAKVVIFRNRAKRKKAASLTTGRLWAMIKQ